MRNDGNFDDTAKYQFLAYLMNKTRIYVGTIDFDGYHELVVVDGSDISHSYMYTISGVRLRDKSYTFLHISLDIFISILRECGSNCNTIAQTIQPILHAYQRFNKCLQEEKGFDDEEHFEVWMDRMFCEFENL